MREGEALAKPNATARREPRTPKLSLQSSANRSNNKNIYEHNRDTAHVARAGGIRTGETPVSRSFICAPKHPREWQTGMPAPLQSQASLPRRLRVIGADDVPVRGSRLF